jgi:hypothetical protein
MLTNRPKVYGENMKPTHNDLCVAMLAASAEPWVLSEVKPGCFEHLATIGLACIGDEGKWELTSAGEKLMPAIINGDDIPPLI